MNLKNLFTIFLSLLCFNLARGACTPTKSKISPTECSSSYKSPSGKYTWTKSGTYMDTLTNAAGCDSILTINLSFGKPSSSSMSQTACDSYTSPSGRHTWSKSGSYSDTVVNASGCDSIISIKLTINNSTKASIKASECDSYKSPSGNYTWTKSGTYMDTISNAVGCDSVITINLVIQSNGSSISPSVCNTYTSPSGKYTWTKSGKYTDTLTNAVGCDSVITIDLSVNSTQSTQKMILCDTKAFKSPSGKYSWSSNGTYYDTIKNGAGCDSFMTFNLTFSSSSKETIKPTVCDSYTSPSGKYTWTKSGSYSDTVVNASGCDSIISIGLTVNYSTKSSIKASECNSYKSPSGNYKWTKSGTYLDTISNAAGCDSIITINLVIQSNGSSISPSVCNTYTSPSGKYTWTKSGKYTDTLTNAVGCDSVITIDLSVNSTQSTQKMILCDTKAFKSPSGKYSWSSTGTYYDTIKNGAGCDSFMTFNLTFSSSSKETIKPTVCDSYTSPSGKYTWTKSGSYSDTVVNAAGCDSIISIGLTVNYSTKSSIKASECNSYKSPSGNYKWTKSGTYLDTISNAAGCDSIITINLVIQSNGSSISPSVCNTYTSPSGKYTWTKSGKYTDTLTNAAGCDSVITIDLSINSTASSISITECDEYTSPSGNYTWTKSGSYTDTLANAVGCDSVITIKLTINNATKATINPLVCDGTKYKSPSGNYTWTKSGTYMDTLDNAIGCDSVITVNLTFSKSTSSTIKATACDEFVSPSGNYTWAKSGQYMDTIANAAGCDSFMTINLTILNSSANKISRSVCDSYTSPSGKYTWTKTGTYSDTLTNSAGCDSIISIRLTILSTSSSIKTTVCDEYTSPSGKYTWTKSGTYMDTLTNSAGCDSVITIGLAVNYTSTSTIKPVACDNYTSPSGNYSWSKSGSFMDTIANSVGCDSIITINLTINNSTKSTINPVACDSYTSPSGDNTWTKSGTYSDVISNSVGCDSNITINLTILESSSKSINVTACNSYTSPSGKVWIGSGVYKDTITNAAGCDSIITVSLKVNKSTSETADISACEEFTSPSGKVWTSSGTYKDTISNTAGCDSIITYNLTIKKSSNALISRNGCNSYTSPSGKYVWTTSGIHLDTIPNAAGCDSFITVDLMLLSTSSSINETACNEYTSPSGKTYSASGTYLDTIPNSAGCDSIITIALVVNLSSSSTISPSVCDSYTVPSGARTLTSAGSYRDTIPNAAGCDSIITINLTLKRTTSSMKRTVCRQFTSPSGKVWTNSGIYTDTIPNQAGCDSIITVDLTIKKVDTSVTQVEDTLTANSTTGTFQWLDCDNGFSWVTGANQARFEPTVTGNYAVMVEDNGCVDTSSCYTVDIVGLNNLYSTSGFTIYPNPTGGEVTIDLLTVYKEVNVVVTDLSGRAIQQLEFTNGQLINFSIGEAPVGVYLITIQADDQNMVSRLLKQ